jgi:hypothetical protein
MSKMKQREAVYQAVRSVLEADEGSFEDGQRVSLSKEQRHDVIEKLLDGFKNGTVELGTEYEDKDLRAYTSSLLNNWLRKDTRLNGGDKYQPKNPGSRAGQSDDQVKALRMLYRAQELQGAEKAVLEQIQQAIDDRVNAVRSERQKPISVDYSKIPAEILSKIGIDPAQAANA